MTRVSFECKSPASAWARPLGLSGDAARRRSDDVKAGSIDGMPGGESDGRRSDDVEDGSIGGMLGGENDGRRSDDVEDGGIGRGRGADSRIYRGV